MNPYQEVDSPPNRVAIPVTVPLLLALLGWGLAFWQSGVGVSTVEQDMVARELRRFHAITDPREKIGAIYRIGQICDPRVTVALMDTVQAEATKAVEDGRDTTPVRLLASCELFTYHIPETQRVYDTKYWIGARMWWETHEVEVRQRAAAAIP